MAKSILEILQGFMGGQMTATSAKGALLDHFQTQSSEKRQTITRQYIDEILAELEAGAVTIEPASEDLEESALASRVQKQLKIDFSCERHMPMPVKPDDK